jgi:hypothetical protein
LFLAPFTAEDHSEVLDRRSESPLCFCRCPQLLPRQLLLPVEFDESGAYPVNGFSEFPLCARYSSSLLYVSEDRQFGLCAESALCLDILNDWFSAVLGGEYVARDCADVAPSWGLDATLPSDQDGCRPLLLG